jgi:integrase/recombinase XerC
MSNSQAIQHAEERYLQERRQLGFDLQSAGKELLRFARFADARHHTGPLTLIFRSTVQAST